MDKTWKKEEIRKLFEENDKAVERGLVVVYSLQTAYEQAVHSTIEHNGVGFNANDAEFLTSLAQSVLQYGSLTPKQLKFGRKRMLKYAGQLAKVANGQIRVEV